MDRMNRGNGHFFALQWMIVLALTNLFVYPVTSSGFTENNSLSLQVPGQSMEPVVTGTSHNATVIRVIGDRICIPVIQYSNASWFAAYGTSDHEISGIRSGSTWVFRLTDLEPDTRYQYRIQGCEPEERIRSFTTFPVTGTCRFIVYGDSREQAPLYTQTERHKLVADRIAGEQDIRFVVNSGDLVADSADGAEWSRFFNATDNLRSRTTYIAVPGNHDQDRALFRDLFGMAEPSSFDCGNARILLLDSTDEAPENLTEQAARVSSAFAFFPGAKIVILHHPPYSSDEKHYGGWENLQKVLVPAFRESGVRLVFSSHVHAFEQVERDGSTYITEARGGAPAYPLNRTRVPGSRLAFENTLGYSRVTVNPEQGTMSTKVIRVADVSPDLRTVSVVYPVGTIDARIKIIYGASSVGFPNIRDLMDTGIIFGKR